MTNRHEGADAGDARELGGADEDAIAAFMAQVAALPQVAPLRDPMPLWWKAQLIRRWDAQHQAQEPLDVMERVEIAAGVAAAVGLFVWAFPTMARVVGPLASLFG